MTEKRYSRNIPALTEAEQRMLGEKTAAVVGCGGLGGYLAEFLARLGIGCLRLIDGDCFEESNLNRQILAERATLGRGKAECAAERLGRINGAVRTEVCPVFLTEENAVGLLSGCDIVLDGLDSVRARKHLADACERLALPCVFGGIGGWSAQAVLSLPGDGIIHRLYPEEAPVPDESVLSFAPALCAAMETALCLRHLCAREVQSGVLQYFDLLSGEFESFPL